MTLNDLECPYTVCDKNVAQDPSFKQSTIYVDIRGGSQERGRQMRVSDKTPLRQNPLYNVKFQMAFSSSERDLSEYICTVCLHRKMS